MFESLGQYKILERLGAGGMGEVYRARDTRLGRTVAIKVMKAEIAGDPVRRERFVEDARASAALSHPNIAALYEIGEDQDQLFLAFEYVPGETLKRVIAGRPLNPRRAIDLAVQIADALADAHAESIVHRDIKSDNIIVTPKGNAKILDVGLARWTASGAGRDHAAQAPTAIDTAAGTTLETVAYMSPEQALGERVDHRTDIFSLGIVIFEMLTGRLPFTATTPAALALQIVQARAPLPSAINRSLPVELDAIVGKAMAKSLDQRYESAATLAAELRSVGAVLDVRSDTQEAAFTPAQPARRSIAGWLVFLALLAAAGAAAWYARAPIQRAYRRWIAPPPAPVIAVVAFDSDPGQTFFADGLAEDLTTRLGQTPGLKVIGRSALRRSRGSRPADAARQLGAAAALTGSVRRSGDTVEVSLELIDPIDDIAIWSQQYTRDVKDIFAVQAQIAEQLAQALRVKLQPTAASARAASRLVDPRAYELYLRGRQATADRRMTDAIGLYEQAIVADAGLAEAFAGIVEALDFNTMAGGVPAPGGRRPRQKVAADRAYQLDPDLPQANLAMGLAAPGLQNALAHMRRAVELDPSYGEGLRRIGDQIAAFDPPLAIRFYRASLNVDPALESAHADIAVALAALDRPDEGHAEIDRVRTEPFPGWRDAFHIVLDLDQRQPDRALARLEHSSLPPAIIAPLRERALATAGRFKDALASSPLPTPEMMCADRALTAALQRDAGRPAPARDLLRTMLALTTDESAEPADLRCAVHAAAAMDDAATVATLLRRIADHEEWLRYWALQVMTDSGSSTMRGRAYPWNRIVAEAPMSAARAALDAAYTRERNVARAALEGLP